MKSWSRRAHIFAAPQTIAAEKLSPENSGEKYVVSDPDVTVRSMERALYGALSTMAPRLNLDELAGKQGLKIYSKMRVDEQVKAVCVFKRDAILSRGWTFEFDKESTLSDTEREHRIRVYEKIIERMPGSFIDALNVISTGREFGFSLTEKVYMPVEIDGKTQIGLHSLRGREPWSFEFYVDPFGDLIKCEQVAGGQRIPIDLDKFIHYVHNPEFDIYFGRSDLREAYRSWYHKEQCLKYWGFYMEKLGGGIVIGKMTNESRIAYGTAEYAALTRTLMGIKATGSVLMPPGVDLEAVFPNNSDSFDKALSWHDLAIAKALLVPNLLGVSNNGGVGSYAQSQTQLDAFAWTVKADTDRLETCLNEQLFKDLGDQNWGDGEYPCLKFKPPDTEKLKWIMETWQKFLSGGAVLPTVDDEKRLREILGMPPRNDDTEILTNPNADKEHELGEKSKDADFERGEKAKDNDKNRSFEDDKKRATDPVLGAGKEEDEEDEENKDPTKGGKKFGARPEGETTPIEEYGFTVDLEALDAFNVKKDDWETGRTRNVTVSSLIATQTNVNAENLENVKAGKPIVVLSDGAKNYILDGHHRAVLAKEAGQRMMQAKVLDAAQFKRKKDFGFNPDQPRDENGRWGDGDGGGNAPSGLDEVSDLEQGSPKWTDSTGRWKDSAFDRAEKLCGKELTPAAKTASSRARQASAQAKKADTRKAYEKAASAHRDAAREVTAAYRAAKGSTWDNPEKAALDKLLSMHNNEASQNSGLAKRSKMTAPLRDARLTIASARRRVDFKVIDHNQTTFSNRLSSEWSRIIAIGTQMLLGDDENLKKLIDSDTSDIAMIEFSGVTKGRLKKAGAMSLRESWALGRRTAEEEIRKTRHPRKTKDMRHFANLRQMAEEYFENNSFRMANNVSDGARAMIQQELQNAVKYGKSPQQTRESIWDRLTRKGFTSREDVRQVETDEGIIQALDELWVDTEEAAKHYLDTLARTNIFEAMNEARFGEFQDPALDGFVVALEYSAILDDRTTHICESLDGVILKTGNPAWDRVRPPNHFNCRSLLIPITELDVQMGDWDGEESELPDVEPQEGFK